MKICFLAGANSIHSWRWVDYFAKKGHDVHWISLAPFTSEVRGFQAHHVGAFPLKFHQFFRALRDTRRLIREIRPQILHIHSVGTYGLLGALSGFHPQVMTAWGSDVLIAGKSFVTRPLVKFALHHGDLITCDAQHMVEAMRELGVPSEKMRVVYFGTDVAKFSPLKRDESIRKLWNVNQEPVVISLRSLEPLYNVETLIQAVPLILNKAPSARFVVAGKGPEHDRLVALSKSLDVADKVRFIGQIPNEDLPRYLASADLYVSTSLSDAGLAASTAEAMACGLPVVVTDSGENGLWVFENQGGFVVPVKSPSKIAEGVLSLLQDPSRRSAYGNFNRRLIEEKNNYFVEMDKMDKIYASIAASVGAGQSTAEKVVSPL